MFILQQFQKNLNYHRVLNGRLISNCGFDIHTYIFNSDILPKTTKQVTSHRQQPKANLQFQNKSLLEKNHWQIIGAKHDVQL